MVLLTEYFLKKTKSPLFSEGTIEIPQTKAVFLHPNNDRNISNKFLKILF